MKHLQHLFEITFYNIHLKHLQYPLWNTWNMNTLLLKYVRITIET
jgi:hypothetical protein